MGNGIYAAMAAVMAEISAIGKDKRCTQGANFVYRGIDDVYNALNPLLGKHQIFVLPQACERTSESRTTKNGGNMEVVTVRMRYVFAHSDGSSVECCTIGEAMDNGDKATNKAMAIAHKYAILQAFCIPTEDLEDPDAVAHSLESREKTQVRKTRETAKASNSDPMSVAQRAKLFALAKEVMPGAEREDVLMAISNIVGRHIESSNALSKAEAAKVIDAMERPAPTETDILPWDDVPMAQGELQ